METTTKPRKPRRKGSICGDKSPTVSALPDVCADETLAVEFVERQRWGNSPCCPRCGDTNVRKMLAADGSRNKRYLWRCGGCRKQYTVRINSVYEDSRIPMRFWVFAFWSACTHKKGVSALQIKRQTGLNYRSALFLMNRIRHAMTPTDQPPPFGGIVEVDEVYIGGRATRAEARANKAKGVVLRGPKDKTPVLAVVERGGSVRTNVVASVTGANLGDFIRTNVASGTLVCTDALKTYRVAVPYACQHGIVRHDVGRYVDFDDRRIHTNSVEGFFNLFRKRIDGTHHSVSRVHLHRYASEAAFVYSARGVDDGERTIMAIRGASGKRLTYKQSCVRIA
ncbi:MAG: IS1595 family transposase [Planctomycetota bacterium]